jgi:hypothetical protein
MTTLAERAEADLQALVTACEEFCEAAAARPPVPSALEVAHERLRSACDEFAAALVRIEVEANRLAMEREEPS